MTETLAHRDAWIKELDPGGKEAQREARQAQARQALKRALQITPDAPNPNQPTSKHAYQCAEQFKAYQTNLYDWLDACPDNQKLFESLEYSQSPADIAASHGYNGFVYLDLLEGQFKPELKRFVIAYNVVHKTNLDLNDVFPLVESIAPKGGLVEQ